MNKSQWSNGTDRDLDSMLHNFNTAGGVGVDEALGEIDERDLAQQQSKLDDAKQESKSNVLKNFEAHSPEEFFWKHYAQSKNISSTLDALEKEKISLQKVESLVEKNNVDDLYDMVQSFSSYTKLLGELANGELPTIPSDSKVKNSLRDQKAIDRLESAFFAEDFLESIGMEQRVEKLSEIHDFLSDLYKSHNFAMNYSTWYGELENSLYNLKKDFSMVDYSVAA